MRRTGRQFESKVKREKNKDETPRTPNDFNKNVCERPSAGEKLNKKKSRKTKTTTIAYSRRERGKK